MTRRKDRPSYNRDYRKSRLCLHCGKITKNPKYCSTECDRLHRIKQRWQEQDRHEVLIGCQSAIKRYLINRRGWHCEICDNHEWRKQPVPLILDHINGDSGDNRRDNLRLVCPNCDAQLPTYKGANRGRGRYYRRERYKAGKSY